ncbi:MAG TPA: rhomboid family intramembrane serine protease [Defluviitaleaceae bacterium]|nr:rhomboid family intramembrane serine protease [Candidatus Epulonipiscium sp.]HOA80474.1 rhomboid family intramembrane serine protease [Defluviitaleaceae bacterium]
MLKKFQYNSPVILTFSLISFLVLLLGVFSGGSTTALLFAVYRTSLKNPLFYLRLFTHVLGHANIQHFVNNFILILLIGPMMEEKYGSKNMVLMMVFTAFITGLVNVIFFNNMLLGASGIVFMLILLSSFANIKKGRIPLTFVLVVIIFIGQEVVNAFTLQDQVSQLTHIIGGICGGLFGYKINIPKSE